MINIKFTNTPVAENTSVAILLDRESSFADVASKLSDLDTAHITGVIEANQYKPDSCKSLHISTNNKQAPSVLLFGLGKVNEIKEKDALLIGSKLYQKLQSLKLPKAILHFPDKCDNDIVFNIVLSLLICSYKFDKYKTSKEEKKDSCTTIEVFSEATNQTNLSLEHYQHLATSIALTRDLVLEPSNVKNPAFIADACTKLSEHGIEVQVLDEKEIASLGMNALIGVAQGSVNLPKVVVMKWNGAKNDSQSIALIGKGVTFDSGGLSLKPSAGMDTMKGDMAGAATVIGIIRTLALRKTKVNVIGVIGLVENMPDGGAQRPGDIVRSMSEQTIEILNTDAEGRLVLADILWYTQSLYKPTVMIDFATLTGAMRVCLGNRFAGLFSNDDALADQLFEAGMQTGEKLWRLPLDKEYDELIDSKIADIKNIADSSSGAGSIVAAQFLQRFVNKTPWAHIDIAAVSQDVEKKNGFKLQGPTAFGLRLIVNFIENNYVQ